MDALAISSSALLSPVWSANSDKTPFLKKNKLSNTHKKGIFVDSSILWIEDKFVKPFVQEDTRFVEFRHSSIREDEDAVTVHHLPGF